MNPQDIKALLNALEKIANACNEIAVMLGSMDAELSDTNIQLHNIVAEIEKNRYENNQS